MVLQHPYYNVTAAGLLLRQTIVCSIVHLFEPFVALLARRTDMGDKMLEPGIALRAMPVFHTLGNVDNVAGLQGYCRLAPLLIPSFAADADEHLTGTMMYMPVVTASGSKVTFDIGSTVLSPSTSRLTGRMGLR